MLLNPKAAASKSGKPQPLFQVDIEFQAPDAIEFSPSGHEFAQRIDATISDFVNMLKTVRVPRSTVAGGGRRRRTRERHARASNVALG